MWGAEFKYPEPICVPYYICNLSVGAGGEGTMWEGVRRLPEVYCVASLAFAAGNKRASTSNEVDSNEVKGGESTAVFLVLHRSAVRMLLPTRTHAPALGWDCISLSVIGKRKTDFHRRIPDAVSCHVWLRQVESKLVKKIIPDLSLAEASMKGSWRSHPEESSPVSRGLE